MSKISKITAREILDSRGNPTIEATVEVSNGKLGKAAVPSGASTGKYEEKELRDKDGGVSLAIKNIKTVIAEKLVGFDVEEGQEAADEAMVELDGTPNKSCLGENAILAVSLALARAAAASKKLPLFQYLREFAIAEGSEVRGWQFPKPLFNILNGGAHAQNNLSIQEFMIIPHFSKFHEALEAGDKIYHVLGEILKSKKLSTGLGDEGGFAPNLKNNTEAIELLVEAIKKAGFNAGKNVSLGLDVAASELYSKSGYKLNGKGMLSAPKMADHFAQVAAYYPIEYLEDPLAEDDWDGWKEITEKLGDRLLISGDDLFVTQTARLAKGINEKAANAIIIKPNQVGTLTETISCVKMAKDAGFKTIVSHRSGETDDDFIADLAVAVGAWGIKAGAPARGERVAKYNRLLEIEEELDGS